MVSSPYSGSPTLSGVTLTEKFHVVPRNSIVNAPNRPDFAPIVSALENYIIFHKSSTKTVHYEESCGPEKIGASKKIGTQKLATRQHKGIDTM